MDFKISKNSGEKSADKQQQDKSTDKKNQTPQLLLLLLLLAGFGYVYFFTGVIRPLPENQNETPPPPQVVRKALPPREAATVSPDENKVKTAIDSPQPATQPVPQAASPVTPAKVQPDVKSGAVAAGDKKTAEPKEVKQKLPEKKASPVAAEKKEIPAVTAQKTSSLSNKQDMEKKPESAVKTKKTATMSDAASWTLVAGNYMLESEMAADMARIRKAGLEPSITSGKPIKAKVNRLYIGEYDERSAAQAVLDKLKRQTADAFILQQGGKFAVYAGSYLLEDRVAEERERLTAAGFSPTIRKVDVSLPSKGLSAGTFNDKKSAEAARAKLVAAGITKASLLECK